MRTSPQNLCVLGSLLCSLAASCTLSDPEEAATASSLSVSGTESDPHGAVMVTLDVSVIGHQALGIVTSSPGGIDCDPSGGPRCSAQFAQGTRVSLGAKKLGGRTIFQGWGGLCSGTGATCMLTLNGNGFVSATFYCPPGGPPCPI